MLAACVAAAALLGLSAWALPLAAGASWTTIVSAAASLHLSELAVLVCVWAAGLVVYSSVLTASLPGLSYRRAMTLNLTGSAVSNLVPLGGTLGIGLNYRMVRRWGFSASSFASFTALTHVVNVLSKLAVPILALAVLAGTGRGISQQLTSIAMAAGGTVAVVAVLLIALLLVSRRLATRTGPVQRAAERLCTALGDAWKECREATARGWLRLGCGSIAYAGLQLLLLWLCLHVAGAAVALPAALAAFAVERLATLLPFTPGGSGLAEVGMTSLLMTLGGAPAATAVGVLIYRGLVFALEIPVGGVWLAVWEGLQRRHRGRTARGPAPYRQEEPCASSM